MSISPKDVLNKNKSLDKRVDVDKINLENVTIDDLRFNGKNYDAYINLQSLLDNVSSCQISDAYNAGQGLSNPLNPLIIKKFGEAFILPKQTVMIGEHLL